MMSDNIHIMNSNFQRIRKFSHFFYTGDDLFTSRFFMGLLLQVSSFEDIRWYLLGVIMSFQLNLTWGLITFLNIFVHL